MGRRGWLGLVVLLVVAAAWGAWHAERTIEARIETGLHGAGVSAGAVRFSWLGPVHVEDSAAALPGGARLSVRSLDLDWRVAGGRDVRRHLRAVHMAGLRIDRGRMGVEWPSAALDVQEWTRDAAGGEHLKLRQRGGGALEIGWSPHEGTRLDLDGLDLADTSVRWDGAPLVRARRWTGAGAVAIPSDGLRSHGAFRAEGVRFAPPPALRLDARGGAPTAVDLEWRLAGEGGTVNVERLSARLDGVELTLQGVVERATGEIDVVAQGRCELAAAFRTAGLPPPLPDLDADRFGTAWLDVSVRGVLGEPASLAIVPKLRFEVTPQVVHALAYLRAPLRYVPRDAPAVVVDVRDGAPSFIAVDDVPARFKRALILSEDAGFYHHPGIDLAEIAAAWAHNEAEGRLDRGASTLTQQLVKNLLLSSEKTYGRKLNEAALALMVDAAVPKARLLEIYVNVIEWGPQLHGLVAAARHYFDKTPAELTAKEAAFLVCLIPNPVRYHQAHVAGRAGPGMEQLMANLLGKLRAVGELTDEEYQAAIDETLQFAPESSAAPAT
jgi:hypothetical protein